MAKKEQWDVSKVSHSPPTNKSQQRRFDGCGSREGRKQVMSSAGRKKQYHVVIRVDDLNNGLRNQILPRPCPNHFARSFLVTLSLRVVVVDVLRGPHHYWSQRLSSGSSIQRRHTRTCSIRTLSIYRQQPTATKSPVFLRGIPTPSLVSNKSQREQKLIATQTRSRRVWPNLSIAAPAFLHDGPNARVHTPTCSRCAAKMFLLGSWLIFLQKTLRSKLKLDWQPLQRRIHYRLTRSSTTMSRPHNQPQRQRGGSEGRRLRLPLSTRADAKPTA